MGEGRSRVREIHPGILQSAKNISSQHTRDWKVTFVKHYCFLGSVNGLVASHLLVSEAQTAIAVIVVTHAVVQQRKSVQEQCIFRCFCKWEHCMPTHDASQCKSQINVKKKTFLWLFWWPLIVMQQYRYEIYHSDGGKKSLEQIVKVF